MAELRQHLGISQAELAERAGVGQANISRIEGRDDLKISTLARVVEAMGGSLSIRARFPDGVEKELEVRRPARKPSRPGDGLERVGLTVMGWRAPTVDQPIIPQPEKS